MKRRIHWAKVRPTNMCDAIEQCVCHAQDKLNLSVERIADLMGLESHRTLYKWISEGRIPAIKILAFEHACGIDFITQYLAHSGGKLLIPMPTGRKAQHREISELSLFMNETVQLLYRHGDGDATADETLSALTKLMEDLAHQQGNVEKEQQPELELNQ